MKLKVTKLHPDAQLPFAATPGAAGLDVHAIHDEIIYPDDIVKVGTGIAIEAPEGSVALLFGRSGWATKGVTLANGVGVIDSDYRGEVIALLTNRSEDPFVIKPGDRIAQIVLLPAPAVTLSLVESLSGTERGLGGFGSTGK